MNDIRPALHQRLQSIEDERATISDRLKRLDDLERMVRELLAEEDRSAHIPQGNLFEAERRPPADPTNLSEWIVKALRTQPRTLDDLKRILANAPALKDHSSPGRAINFALVGLQKGGHVERLENGAWKLSPEGVFG